MDNNIDKELGILKAAIRTGIKDILTVKGIIAFILVIALVECIGYLLFPERFF